MKNVFFALALVLNLSATTALAQDATATVHADRGTQKIYKEIYGQFAEHLGTCIYGGLWVGPESSVPNTDGYRNDMLAALRQLHVPVLRWPGGCFADEYHWMDGIGPRSARPKMQNNNWGGTIEDNSFGTHEFLNLCELLGAEPYISGNVGSGTVEELAKWIEYMTSAGDTPMAKLRRENGRQEPWRVKYVGVGNESWGCGGDMRPEYYADLYRRYAVYCRNYDGNRVFKVASGASDYDYNWTQVLMNQVGDRMDGLSLHYYTVGDWDHKGSATTFDPDDYYRTMGKCLEIEDVIRRHEGIMDAADPERKIALLVDEWGTWWDEEPGTVSGHLYQQNTMRDAMVAALTLNVFHRHTQRIRMANIAQVANVLQSMILTDTIDGGHLTLTPTYHVFRMYQPFQEATYLPLDLVCDSLAVKGDGRAPEGRRIPLVSASAARTVDGQLVFALANISLDREQTVRLQIDGAQLKTVEGEILASNDVAAHNDFASPDVVKPTAFKGARLKDNTVSVRLPAHSIVVIKASDR